MFGTVSWIGGSFCRYVWLVLLIGGFCLLARKKYFLAGGLLAGSAALRIFPALFLVPLMLKVLRGRTRDRPTPQRYRRLLAGIGTAWLLAIAGTTLTVGGSAWLGFFENMGAYLRIDATNAVGFQVILSTAAQNLGIAQTSMLSTLLFLTLSALLALILALAASRVKEPQSLAAGAVLCFLVFDLGGYYYMFLIIPFLVANGSWHGRAAFFGCESLCYLAHFALGAEDHVLFLIRSLVLGLLLFGTWLDRGAREATARWFRLTGRLR